MLLCRKIGIHNVVRALIDRYVRIQGRERRGGKNGGVLPQNLVRPLSDESGPLIDCLARGFEVHT